MKKLFALILVFVMVMLSSCGLVNTSVIGTINGNEISLSEFNYFLSIIKTEMLNQTGATDDKTFWETQIDGKKAIDIAKEKAFDEAFAFEAKYLKAEENGFGINEERILEGNKQYASMVSQYGGDNAFSDYLKQMGSDKEAVKQIMRKSYCISLYLDEYAKEQNSPLYVSEEEINTAKQELYNSGQLVSVATAKHILISTKDDSGVELSDNKKEEKRLLAEKIYNEIKDGGDFDALMNKYSEDPGLSAYPDGYTFGPGEMVPEFESVAFSLNQGEVSQPVLSEHGYHIIKLIEKETMSGESVDLSVKEYLLSQKESELGYKWKGEYKIIRNDEVYNKIK